MNSLRNIYNGVFGKMNVEEMKSEETVREDQLHENEENAQDKSGSSSTAVDEGSESNGSTANQEEATEEGMPEGADGETLDPNSPEARIVELEEKLAAAEAKADENLDRLQRTAAEFQNAKRRQEKQLADSISRAAQGVINGLLPIMDDFDLAFKNLPEDISVDEDPWVSGFHQIQKKLNTLFDDQDVTMMALDGEFDPNRHEAVSSEPSEDVESGHIIETLRAGYEYKEKVLRPALVRVAM